MKLTEPFACPDDPEAAALVQPHACVVLGKYAALDGPDLASIGPLCEGSEELAADPLSSRRFGDIDAVLADPGVDTTIRYRTERHPPDDVTSTAGDQPILR
jgi:hypothetical protein